MNVLSLFDGISCGQVALQRTGIAYGCCYSSEIDKDAIRVTQSNFPETIQLGNILQLDCSMLPKIDLLFAGSPCQGFSFGNKHKLAFGDPRSRLFFEFVRVLKETQPTYFLLENVLMKKEHQKVITDILGIKPILVDSALVSAQHRKRLYWTNIPDVKQPTDRRIFLSDIVEDSQEYIGAAQRGRYEKDGSTSQKLELNKEHKSNALTTIDKDSLLFCPTTRMCRRLTAIEKERLQTLPDDYTAFVSETKRHKLLGNAWTVDVIVHILKNIKGGFE